MWLGGRLAEAVDLMDRSFQVLVGEEPDEDLAWLAAELGRQEYFAGRIDVAMERVETAIEVAESLWLPEVLSQALNTQGLILYSAKGRRRQGYALLRYALELALEYDSPAATFRAYFNLADLTAQNDRYQEARDYVEAGLALARRLGDRSQEWLLLGQVYPHYVAGAWDTALEMMDGIPTEKAAEHRLAGSAFLLIVPLIHVQRGEIPQAERAFAVYPGVESSADVQERSMFHAGEAVLHLARGQNAEALGAARDALFFLDEVGPAAEPTKEAVVAGLEAAARLNEAGLVQEFLGLIERIPRGKLPPYLHAHAERFRAWLAATRDRDDIVQQLFKSSTGLFREIAAPFHMAVVLLEHGEWLVEQDRETDAEPLFLEAHEIFERLKATPWLGRLERVAPAPFAEASEVS
jgi:tetratricopeptide (TPR) repeat protein